MSTVALAKIDVTGLGNTYTMTFTYSDGSTSKKKYFFRFLVRARILTLLPRMTNQSNISDYTYSPNIDLSSPLSAVAIYKNYSYTIIEVTTKNGNFTRWRTDNKIKAQAVLNTALALLFKQKII